MVHWWDELTFLHWRYEPDEVQRLLPAGLEVETMRRLGVGRPGPVLPAGRAPRRAARSRGCRSSPRPTCAPTCAAPTASRGIWFFSLDAARLGAVVVARATYRLPYFWSRMRARARRPDDPLRVPAALAGTAGCAEPRSTSRSASRYAPDELTELDHFLTARWALYSAPRSRPPPRPGLPRPVAAAPGRRRSHLDDELVAAAGLPQPEGEPLVHYSPSVEVRIGWPYDVADPTQSTRVST